MHWVDTHVHLDCKQYEGRVDEVLARAADAGVLQLLCVGTGLSSARRAVEIAESHAGVFAVVGFDPHNCGEVADSDFDELISLARRERVVAIGEIGLDYYHDSHPRPVQRGVFARQLGLAAAAGMPVCIHTRDAAEDTRAILREGVGPAGGVMHCFSGDGGFAEFCLGLGMYLSAAGPVTYPKADALREVFRGVPAERLLLETDSPYLTPQVLRGRTNEPAYLVHTAEVLARVRGMDPLELAETTTANAGRLFGLPAADLLRAKDV